MEVRKKERNRRDGKKELTSGKVMENVQKFFLNYGLDEALAQRIFIFKGIERRSLALTDKSKVRLDDC